MSAEAAIEGFEAPIHRALVEPILLGGAPPSRIGSTSARWIGAS